ncbi:MAG: beta-N-acetylhexosaminidase [Christensenellaceae bacterium]|nr:beta-N-acetylhexosaminidase [Christensenellaceae bacterium]
MRLCFHGLPEELRAGLDRVAPLLQLNEAPDGLAVTVERQGAPGLAVSKRGDRALIRYHHRVEFFRALSLLKQRGGEAAFELHETCCFDRNGVMLDCSRGAVLTPDCMRDLLAKMALMGLNWAMLYTEDTYEIEAQPYFGYLRGRYTQEELRALDDCADELGIEMIPCIQTLAHLECALRWPGLEQVQDSYRSLMVGEDATYALIEQMIVAASSPFRSKRINIGMDEAWELGLGNYLSKYGYKPCAELMDEHLRRVRAIIKKHGLKAMMWSDMHFYAASPARLLYDPDCVLTSETLSAAPPEIDLAYWDYYHEDEAHYEKLLKLHARFEARTVFAGGIWSWNGPVVDYARTINTTLPALAQCRKQNVREVFATAWGDDGAETNLTAILYGLQLYAEYGYTGGYDAEEVARRFEVCAGASAQAFLDLSRLNVLPGIAPPAGDVSNPLKNLLYEDPLLPIFEEDLRGVPAAEHYEQLIPLYERYARENPGYALLFEFHAHIARVLNAKCRWRDRAATCVRERDGAQIARMPALALEVIRALEALRLAWFELWHSTNKPFGFEVIDIRLGGLIARFGTAARRFEALRDGSVADIPELSTTKLPYLRRPDGAYEMLNHWIPVVTPGHIGMR